jgi:hypothetical protein
MALYEARLECYGLVTEALGEFDEMLDRATAEGNGKARGEIGADC